MAETRRTNNSDLKALYNSRERSRRETKTSTGRKKPQRTGNGKNSKGQKGRRRGVRQKNLLIAALAVMLMITGIVYTVTKKDGLEVLVGEKTIGIVKAKEKELTTDALLQTVTAQLKEQRGSDIKINETLTVKPVHISGKMKKELATIDYIIPKVREAVTYKVSAAIIKVDGTEAAVLSNAEEAQEVLKAIQKEYIPEGTTMEATFVENVETVTDYVDSDKIITVEAATDKFKTGTKIQKPYVVQSGDSIMKIAANANMTTEEFLGANAGMTIETKIRVGATVNILVEKPFVSVKTVETIKQTTVEPKTYETRDDDTKNKGYKKVIQQGKDGQKEVTVQVIRINGFEEERKEVSSTIIEEPVKEIIVQGTK